MARGYDLPAMNQPDPPSAADLGISEVELDRILRDVRHRQGQPTTPPIPDPVTERRFTKLLVLALVALVVAVILVPQLRADDSGEPVFAFMETYDDGKPVTYTSCRPIQVAVYPTGGPPGAETLVREAVATMRSATGLDLVVIGSYGGHAPNWNFEVAPVRPDDPITVSWQDGEAIAAMTDDTAGLGGSYTMSNSDGSRRFVAGTIALSRDYYAELAQRGDRAEAEAVLMHEFGHVLGLDHVHSRHELMNEDNVGLTTLGPGDREGLRRLGQGPCF